MVPRPLRVIKCAFNVHAMAIKQIICNPATESFRNLLPTNSGGDLVCFIARRQLFCLLVSFVYPIESGRLYRHTPTACWVEQNYRVFVWLEEGVRFYLYLKCIITTNISLINFELEYI